MAIGSVFDGDVTFEYTTDFNTSLRDTVNVDFTGAGTGDMAYESWWFYRVQGDPLETALARIMHDSSARDAHRSDFLS
jgi:hypothetical protein